MRVLSLSNEIQNNTTLLDCVQSPSSARGREFFQLWGLKGRRNKEQVTVLLCDRQLFAGQCGCGLEPAVHVPPQLRALWRRAMGTVVKEAKGISHIQLDTGAEDKAEGAM